MGRCGDPDAYEKARILVRKGADPLVRAGNRTRRIDDDPDLGAGCFKRADPKSVFEETGPQTALEWARSVLEPMMLPRYLRPIGMEDEEFERNAKKFIHYLE